MTRFTILAALAAILVLTTIGRAEAKSCGHSHISSRYQCHR
jgi:hypothetical protein